MWRQFIVKLWFFSVAFSSNFNFYLFRSIPMEKKSANDTKVFSGRVCSTNSNPNTYFSFKYICRYVINGESKLVCLFVSSMPLCACLRLCSAVFYLCKCVCNEKSIVSDMPQPLGEKRWIIERFCIDLLTISFSKFYRILILSGLLVSRNLPKFTFNKLRG